MARRRLLHAISDQWDRHGPLDGLTRTIVPTLRELLRAWNDGALRVEVDGTEVGTRGTLNLEAGSGITLTGTDDGTEERVDVEIEWDGLKVRKNSGANVGTRRRINLIEGTNITLTVTDDAGDGEVDVTITGSVSAYTDEMAQDAIGTILLDSATIDFTYDDATPTITAIVIDDSISNLKLRNSGALSVIGRSANSSGDPADISAVAASDAVLRESGSVLGFGTIATGGIADDAVTFAKLQNISTDRLLGRDTAGSGNVEELTVGSGISFSGAGGIVWDGLVVRKNSGADVGTRRRVNLIEGSNITLTVADDAGDGEVDVTIASTGGGVTDHGALTGLGDDDHTQYLLLAGRAGGQTAYGGTAASENLNLNATSHATKGTVTITGLREKIAAGDSLWIDATNRNVLLGSSDPGNVATLSGTDNVAIGDNALGAATTAAGVVAVGSGAAASVQTVSTGGVFIGFEAANADTNPDASTAIGYRAAFLATTFDNCTFLGMAPAPYGGSQSTIIGAIAGYSASGPVTGATYVGFAAHQAGSTASNYATAIGWEALLAGSGATGTTAIGAIAGQNVTTGAYNLLLGYNAAPTLTSASNCIVLGAYEDTSVYADAATASTDGQIVIATEGSNELAERIPVHIVVMPYTEAGGVTDGNVIVGSRTGNWRAGIVAGGGYQNALFGSYNAPALTSGYRNLIAGTANAASLTTGARNLILGYSLDTPAAGTNDYLSIGGAIFGDISSNKTIRLGGSGVVSQTERLAVTQATDDTSEVFSVETTGASGAKSRVYVGTQAPGGTITADPGSLYYRVNGTSSSVYVNTGAASGTTWTNLDSSSGVSDGDKGDIVVTGSGATWTLEMVYAPGSLTLATGTFRQHAKRLQMTTSQRLTAAGTARFSNYN